jgi:hypothetical protein
MLARWQYSGAGRRFYLGLARTFLYSSALQHAIKFVAAILIDWREWLDVHVRVANSAYRRERRKRWDCQRCGSSGNRSSLRFLWHRCALYLCHDRDRQADSNVFGAREKVVAPQFWGTACGVHLSQFEAWNVRRFVLSKPPDFLL